MTDIQGLYLDYAPDGTEDDELLAIKERVAALDTPSKNIWLLYCEYGTYTAVARLRQNLYVNRKFVICSSAITR